MDEKLICLQLGALLHDIGKIVRRAGLDSKEHSEAGSNYLKNNNLSNIGVVNYLNTMKEMGLNPKKQVKE